MSDIIPLTVFIPATVKMLNRIHDTSRCDRLIHFVFWSFQNTKNSGFIMN